MGCLGLNEWLWLGCGELVETEAMIKLDGLTKQAKSICSRDGK